MEGKVLLNHPKADKSPKAVQERKMMRENRKLLRVVPSKSSFNIRNQEA